jgi:hypothetical protein
VLRFEYNEHTDAAQLCAAGPDCPDCHCPKLEKSEQNRGNWWSRSGCEGGKESKDLVLVLLAAVLHGRSRGRAMNVM